jgi:phosphate-selective porin OprO/OprP
MPRSCIAGPFTVVLGAVLLLLISAGAGAQETEPPERSPTAAPTPVSTSPVETEPSDEPTPVPEPSDQSAAAAEATPTPAPEVEPPDDPEVTTEDAPVVKTDEETAIPAGPEKQFDLNPYPQTAKKKPKEKWHTFTDGVRGLLVWDFFDSKLTIRAHARLQIDGTLARADEKMESFYGELGNSLDVRRLQLFAQGTIDHHLRYSLSFDFGTDAGFGDIFVEGRDHGLNIFGYRVGQFRLGSFQEPFSFERVMSSYYTGFLERSLPVWAFAPGSNIGYMVFDTTKNKRFSWAVGFFSWGQTNESNSSNSVLSVTSRITWLPVYRDGGRKLLHIGGSFSTRDPNGDVQYRSRPEARFVDFLVDTGNFAASRIHLYGLEFVGVHGPLTLQSELIVSEVNGTESGNLRFWGSYVEVGWFLTGDQQSYDTGLGVFSRVIPKHESRGLFKKKPGGALVLTGRVSNIDLDEGGISGGQMTDFSFGVNWYLSSTSAVKLNYIHSTVKDRGHANILILRYQFRPLPVPGWR